jgi:hypothetical protein
MEAAYFSETSVSAQKTTTLITIALKTPKLASICPFNHLKQKDRGVRKNRRRVGERESHGRNYGWEVGQKEHPFFRRFPGFARSSF